MDQRRRLEETFNDLKSSVEALTSGAELINNPSFASPDRALVFQTIGPIEGFVEAARSLGFEWLTEGAFDSGEFEEELDSDSSSSDGASPVTQATLYLTMPSLDGLRRILALWNRYISGESKPGDAGAWWKVFGYLDDVRVWSAQDRVGQVAKDYITRMFEVRPNAPVRIELDLWFRDNKELRQHALVHVEALMEAVGGSVIDFVTIPDISYQAALVELSAREAERLRNLQGPIAVADQVMSVRPQSIARAEWVNRPPSSSFPARAQFQPSKSGCVAILDGYPIQNHRLLAGHVDVEEVDIRGVDVPVARRRHGTAMASLVVHGDLSVNDRPLGHLVKVVPILAAPQNLHEERTPQDKLPIGLVYRAIEALKVGLAGGEPQGRDVLIVNHSICDVENQYAGRPTPWARLLDHLAFKYNLLFVVSAGNSRRAIPFAEYDSKQEYLAATDEQRQIALLKSAERSKGGRCILSPAESVNSICTASAHLDDSGAFDSSHIDPFAAIGVANISSSFGLGIGRSVKPDLIESGGRQALRFGEGGKGLEVWGYETGANGHLAACPDSFTGDLGATDFSTGTSNAAALTTRFATRVADTLQDLFASSGEDWLNAPTRAALTKALVLHSCAWRDAGQLLDAVYPPLDKGAWSRRRESIARSIGYGRPDPARLFDDSGSRITLIGDDVISDGERHSFHIPVPREMLANRDLRRVVITLAWNSPIDSNTLRYRGVTLDLVDGNGARDFWSKVKKVPQPSMDAGKRGTIQHVILEGETLIRASAGAAQAMFEVCVQARATMSEFKRTAVAYGLAVTMEIATSARSTLFADVQSRIKPKHEVKPRAGVPTRVRI